MVSSSSSGAQPETHCASEGHHQQMKNERKDSFLLCKAFSTQRIHNSRMLCKVGADQPAWFWKEQRRGAEGQSGKGLRRGGHGQPQHVEPGAVSGPEKIFLVPEPQRLPR